MRILRFFLEGIMWSIVLMLTSPLLFWLGRPRVRTMEPDLAALDVDDPGVDVDGMN